MMHLVSFTDPAVTAVLAIASVELGVPMRDLIGRSHRTDPNTDDQARHVARYAAVRALNYQTKVLARHLQVGSYAIMKSVEAVTADCKLAEIGDRIADDAVDALSPHSPTTRLDPAPLLAITRGMRVQDAVILLGVSARTVERWRSHGDLVGWLLADRIACNLGRHPAELWPEWASVGVAA